MKTFGRYMALQMPSAGLLALLLWFLHGRGSLSATLALLIVAAWVAKDLALYPVLKSAYSSEPSRMVGPERMEGELGTTHEKLAPQGYVEVHGELWQARLADEHAGELRKGERIRVEAVRGLTLIVRAHPPEGEPG